MEWPIKKSVYWVKILAGNLQTTITNNSHIAVCPEMENIYTFFFYRQLHFSFQPGVANGFWENEAESCLVVA